MRPPPLLALGAAAIAACAAEHRPAAAAPREFVIAERGRLIVQVERDGRGEVRRRTLLRASDVPAEWEPAPGARLRVGADSFHLAAPSPDGRRVAWQAGATHALLGVQPALGAPAGDGAAAPPRVLDFFFDSRASAVLWSPDGRHLLARYTGPSGSAEARLYDAHRGRRLAAPWEGACRLADGCAVTAARWTGAGAVAVTTTAGGAREYRVGAGP